MANSNSVLQEDLQRIIESRQKELSLLEGRTILITGATGMVGRYLALTLLEYSRQQTNESKKIRVVINSVTGNAKIDQVFGSQGFEIAAENRICKPAQEIGLSDYGAVDYIVHAASYASPKFFSTDPVGIIDANFLGSHALLELSRVTRAKFCLISTMEIYGEVTSKPYNSDQPVYVSEEDYGAVDTLAPRSAYPESKRLSETLAIAYHDQHQVDVAIARLTHTYGPGMSLSDGRIQADFMRKALSGEKLVLNSTGSSRRTYTYIADATDAILLTMLNADSESPAYNIADNNSEISIKELAENILLAANRSTSELEINVTDPHGTWNKATGRVIVETDKIRALGWHPVIGIKEGLNRTAAYHQEEAQCRSVN